jgi:hypothetical protein
MTVCGFARHNCCGIGTALPGKRSNASDRREKMRAALTKKCRTLRALDQYIDPRAAVVGTADIILASLKMTGLGSEPGSLELRTARRGMSALLRTARQLNRMKFWDSLAIPRTQQSRMREATHEQRSELLSIAREHLQGDGATRADVLAAMDVLHEVVANMNTIFAAGRVVGMDEPDESWATDRFICAALLPALAEQLNNFWVQLHETDCDRSEK